MKIVTLLRKPLEGSVADNTLKHGCGGLNIDATRVSTSDNLNGGAYRCENPTDSESVSYSLRKGIGEYEQPSGRWPANFILNHLEECVKSAMDWICVEGCSVKKLDTQTGILKGGTLKANAYMADGRKNSSMFAGGGIYSNKGYSSEEGGASRFFMQFKKDPEE